MKLVIVESPAKSKTIEKYLGDEYKVLSSQGHIRELATSGKGGLGIDVENGFIPTYKDTKLKSKIIKELKKEAKNAEFVYIATDPDREGEAIGWHLAEVLNLNHKNENRIVFNEITKTAVLNAMSKPRCIDLGLVSSQETRRMLDRIIGFKLSKLLQNKIKSKSAGRVQSVALRIIVERERLILAFVPEEYWTIEAVVDKFKIDLDKYKNKKVELKTEKEADLILGTLSEEYTIKSIDSKDKKKKSKPPYITSTLQQDANNKLNFNAKKTMRAAQKLYEGIEIDGETNGLITYLRTDSTRLSSDFVFSAYDYIEKNYGKEYVGFVKVSKKDNIQDAHEAIRPTSLLNTPIKMKKHLSSDEFKLYQMIYSRALASLMSEAISIQKNIVFTNNDALFKLVGSTIKFEGYLKVYKDYETFSEKILPDFEIGQVLKQISIDKIQHFTQPPGRYNEAKLIKEMEELGIGRPSTYAQTIDTLLNRGYVEMEAKAFKPTEQGFITSDKLVEFFNSLINVEYTANMESDLDKIAVKEALQLDILQPFFTEFEELLAKAYDDMPKIEPKKTGEPCPECGNELVIRRGRFGEFKACSNYPTCKYIKNETEAVCGCPVCHEGEIVEKRTKKGKIFFACNNYPKCKTAYWHKPILRNCPDCNEMLLEKGKKIVCSSCKYSEDIKED